MCANPLACGERRPALAAFTCLAAAAALVPRPAAAQTSAALPYAVPDAASSITLDGRLDEPAWAHAVRLSSFYETWPGDNVTPPVRTVAAITYDARFLYIGLWAQDPDPSRLHAALTDRDNLGSADDYISIVLDTRGDGRSGTIVRISPRGVQTDGVFNEAQFALGTADDFTPDFAWDAATAIGDSGWTAELRIPLAALRYPRHDPQRWGIIVHRNYPRAFVHNIFSVPLPRGTNCFLCHEQFLELRGLPSSGALVAAPFAAARADRTVGRPTGPSELRGGADLKWTPGASTAVDATLRPDFSQIESDVPQLGVNTQFALFYPEKRPFFLEGADLFQTPLQAAYTRSITAPDWGVRATGEVGRAAYTMLIARDRGGGSVILPGAAQSSLVPEDFGSIATIVRERTALGSGFVGVLATDREVAPERGGGHNRLVGPDFLWSATPTDQLGGQLLVTDTRVPNRPDLTAAWQGGALSSAALDLTWHHLDRRFEWFADYRDVGAGFRADLGFVPQVGVALVNSWANVNFFPTGAINWVSPWLRFQRVVAAGGGIVSEYRYAGIWLSGARNLNLQLRYSDERLQALDALFGRRYAWLTLDVAPGRRFSRAQLTLRSGGDVDVVNGRTGSGGEATGTFILHPTEHVELQLLSDVAWLDIPVAGASRRLFTAVLERLRATYHFSPRAALRLIAQNVRIERDPALYLGPTDAHAGGVTVSALLSYRWGWETAAYLGFGHAEELTAVGRFAPAEEQIFFKLQVARP